MIRGFKQTAGIGYHEKFNLVLEKFSPVARFDSIKIILSVSVTNKIYLQQFNVKAVFLYGEKLIYKVICSNRRDTKKEGLTVFAS